MKLDFNAFQQLNPAFKELDLIRKTNFEEFQRKGLPSKKQEKWKYTDLKTIFNNNLPDLEIFNNKKNLNYNKELLLKNFDHNKIILLNGNYVEKDFSFENEKKISIKSLEHELNEEKNFEKIKIFFNLKQNSLEELNNALAVDGIILEIEDNYSFNKPIIIYNFFDKFSENKIINSKVFIKVGKQSKLNLIEYFNSEDNIKYFNNTVHHYSIQKDAILKKFSINNGSINSYNYHLTKSKSYTNSVFENFLFSLNAKLIKNDIHCDLLEPFSSCFVNSALLLNNNQHQELKTDVNHIHENCKSSQLVKSVLFDESSGTFQGKIFVDQNAQKTNGYQLSKALILSEKSEFNSKPELEIYADDVKCSHGSTSGNIDENSLFYLMSRGISRDDANKMIIKGFLNEAIETITESNVKSLILELFSKRLKKINIKS
jgi:Fe-S cluster assembly protein SufD